MQFNARRLALCAVLVALALALSYVENFIPLGLVIPLPGIKLGLANLVTLFALFHLPFPAAWAILIVRCLLGSAFAGNASALIFSLLGGICALLLMALLKRSRKLSLFGVSIGGAAAHNMGQVLAAMAVLGNPAPLYYLPALLLVSIGTGALTAAISGGLFRALPKGFRF